MSWFLAAAGFAALIVLHEFGHFSVAKAVGMRVERFSLFFPPFIARKRIGETEYALGSLPFGGYVKISGMNPDESLPDEVRTRAYYAQPVWKRIAVISAGPAMNLLLAFLLLFMFFWQIGPLQGASHKVGAVAKGFPADGRLHPGDRLLAVDGRHGSPRELSRLVAAHRCAGKPVDGCQATTPARLLMQRGSRRFELSLRPVYDARVGRTRLGFVYAAGGPRKPYAAGKALDVSERQFWFFTKETVSLPARLFNPERRKEISGVVGSYEVTRETIQTDAGEAVGLLAIISLSLAIVNLFPFLPLDGGHIFWAVVEKVRRRPVSFATMERAGVIGFMLVIGLFIIGLTNDIDRLTGQGFNVR